MNQTNALSLEPSRRGCRGCRKSSDLPRLLGGAALQRCGKGSVLNPASAAEVMLTASLQLHNPNIRPWIPIPVRSHLVVPPRSKRRPMPVERQTDHRQRPIELMVPRPAIVYESPDRRPQPVRLNAENLAIVGLLHLFIARRTISRPAHRKIFVHLPIVPREGLLHPPVVRLRQWIDQLRPIAQVINRP